MAVTLAVTSVSAAPDAASQSLTFDQPRVVIGRGAHADVRLPSRAVSDKHAVLRVDAGEMSIMDEGSTNGTTVNGQSLVHGRKKLLRAGDRIGVAGFEILVTQSIAVSDPPDRTAAVARKLLADALLAVGGEAAPPEVELRSGRRAGQKWRLPPAPSRLVAGRGEMCEIVLDDADCSRQHVEVVRDREGVVFVRDLGSKNGMFAGGRRLTEKRLRDGDEFTVGRSVMRYADPAEELLRAFDVGADEPAPPAPAPVSVPPPSLVPPPPATALVAPASGAPTPAVESPSKPPEAALPASAPAGVDSALTAPDAAVSSDSAVITAREADRASALARRRPSRGADWVVIVLAVVILGISVAALYFVLRGGPTR